MIASGLSISYRLHIIKNYIGVDVVNKVANFLKGRK